MELDTLTPDLPALLIEMGIKYDPDKLAAHLASKWPQVGHAARHSSGGTLIGRAAAAICVCFPQAAEPAVDEPCRLHLGSAATATTRLAHACWARHRGQQQQQQQEQQLLCPCAAGAWLGIFGCQPTV
jgi:hypothetical protein